jgi:hypothetical protein
MNPQEIAAYVSSLHALGVEVNHHAQNLLANVTLSSNTENFEPMFIYGHDLGFSGFHSREDLILEAGLQKAAKLCPPDLHACLPLWKGLPENGHTILAMEPQLVSNEQKGVFSFKKTDGRQIIGVEFVYLAARWCHAHPWTFQQGKKTKIWIQ